ncbi:MAG: FAD-binding oxidoreductase [Caulobacteraceae bacterium]
MNLSASPQAAHGAGVLLDALGGILGDRVTGAQAIREHHAGGEGSREHGLPDFVAFPETSEEVAALLALCHETRTPVIPFGAGTSLEGQLEAPSGGVSLDLSGMNRILEVNAGDLDCRVQAGVTREQLNAELRSHGLFFSVDPGANATLGGMASTRASGTNTVRYGAMRELTMGLTVVTPDGRIITTGGRARKSAAGYDLTRLFVGAEGTLGVITELQMRVFGLPEETAAAVCQYPDLKSAIDTVILTLQMGVPVARIELLDALYMQACIAYSKLDEMAVQPTLFLEFHGSKAGVADQVEQFSAISAEHGGGALQWAAHAEDRTRLWKARHEAYFAGRALAPGKDAFITDACVPISALTDCIMETRAEADASGLICPIIGHVGDGNFHVMMLHDADDSAQRAKAAELTGNIARRALRHGGTCTGEHGVGLHKRELLREEHGEGVDLMKTLKAAFDPHGIMNPGKLFL